MDVVVETSLGGVDIFALKLLEVNVAFWYDEVAYEENAHGQNESSVQIRSKHASVAYTAAEDGDYFGVSGHLRGEKECGDENEQRSVEVEEVGNEVKVVLEDYLFQRCLVLEEVVKLFGNVEGYDDDDDEHKP